MKLTLIAPRLAIQKADFLGSGVPYWPIELATLAAFARLQGDNINVIDLFGENPCKLSNMEDHYLQGVAIDDHLEDQQIRDSDGFIVFAISYMSHFEVLYITTQLKASYPKTPIAILENSQAVTAYSLQHVALPFFEAGADFLICGEPYHNWDEIKKQFIYPSQVSTPSNLITENSEHKPNRKTEKKFIYPLPAWELFNLKGYWGLPYSHGPKTPKFLPVLTSRGCAYACDFCVVPETNNRQWRGKDPENVVDDFIFLRDRFGVHDFQIEDLNPTLQRRRWERICELLVEKNANIRFYFVSGTKAETVPIDKIPLFAEAGCRYISISPESGSEKLMKEIGKSFNYQHGLDLIKACKKNGIRTQACLLVGHPKDTAQSFIASENYLRRIVKAGLDEVAIFIVASFAGSALFENNHISLDDKTALPSFSPKGRVNYDLLESQRKSLIRTFFLWKMLSGLGIWFQGLRSLFGIPQTKMENLPRRILFIYYLIFKHKMNKNGRCFK